MEYLTITKQASDTLIERRSRFIATAAPVEDAEQAEAFISRIKAENKDATHHVFAYIIDSGHLRASDDGEPAGTAGAPILELLKKAGLTRTCIVVTRYFGGVLLGTGGLIRAYTAAAKLAVDAAGIARMTLCDCLTLTTSYSDNGNLQNALSLSQSVVTDTVYSETISISFYIPQEQTATLTEKLINLTAGRVKIMKTESKYLPVTMQAS